MTNKRAVYQKLLKLESTDFKMADYLNTVNTFLIYIFLLLCVVIQVKTKEEYIPALIWTSKEYQEKKNVDYLVMKKIKSDLFESYLVELVKGQKTLVVVFLEKDLGAEDLEWGHKSGLNRPFLSNLTANSRVDYFQSVQSPHKSVARLYGGYNVKYFKPGGKFNFKEKDLVFVEFQKIKSRRAEILRSHDEQIEDIHRQLMESGRSWICIYTAKNPSSNHCKSKQLDSWYVEEHLKENPVKPVPLHKDNSGLTFVTEGSIQLHLPSQKSSAVKIKENYLGASVKSSHQKIDFVIWFLKYTLSFYLNEKDDELEVEGAKLLNEEGESLVLTLIQKDMQQKNNCYIEAIELKSEGKSLVKIILSIYKFPQFQLEEEQCIKPYGFFPTFSFLLLSLITAILGWKKMLDKFDFSRTESVVRIPTENLWAVDSQTLL